MTQKYRSDLGVSTLYPPDIVAALVLAGQNGDLPGIDAITDDLVVRGLCRPRWVSDWEPAHAVAATKIRGGEAHT